MASQIPVVFLPSGISRISPDGLETGDPQIDQEVLLYRERNQSGTTKTLKLNEKIPRLISTSAMEGLDKSDDFLHDMAMDEVEKMSDCEQDESQRETSTRPNSTEPTTANAKTLKTYQSHVRVFKGMNQNPSRALLAYNELFCLVIMNFQTSLTGCRQLIN